MNSPEGIKKMHAKWKQMLAERKAAGLCCSCGQPKPPKPPKPPNTSALEARIAKLQANLVETKGGAA